MFLTQTNDPVYFIFVFGIIPFIILALIIYVIINLLRHKNKGQLDYKDNPLNILENDTTEEENKE